MFKRVILNNARRLPRDVRWGGQGGALGRGKHEERKSGRFPSIVKKSAPVIVPLFNFHTCNKLQILESLNMSQIVELILAAVLTAKMHSFIQFTQSLTHLPLLNLWRVVWWWWRGFARNIEWGEGIGEKAEYQGVTGAIKHAQRATFSFYLCSI